MIKTALALDEELDQVGIPGPATLICEAANGNGDRKAYRVVAGNTSYYICKTTSSNINECGALVTEIVS